MQDTANRRALTGKCISPSSGSPAAQIQGGRPSRFGDLVARFVAGVNPDAAEAYVNDRVQFRVGRLAEKCHLPPEEQEDLAQDLMASLVQAIPTYNCRRSKWKTFVCRVLNRRYCYLLRRLLRVENGQIPQIDALDDLGEDSAESVVDPSKGGGDPAATADLRIDMEAVLAKMPADHQEIAQLLMHHSIRKAAKIHGTTPSTIRWAMRQIRACFKAAGLQVFLGDHDTFSPVA